MSYNQKWLVVYLNGVPVVKQKELEAFLDENHFNWIEESNYDEFEADALIREE